MFKAPTLWSFVTTAPVDEDTDKQGQDNKDKGS